LNADGGLFFVNGNVSYLPDENNWISGVLNQVEMDSY